jgi:DNA-binding GntR family transcriptional regulator
MACDFRFAMMQRMRRMQAAVHTHDGPRFSEINHEFHRTIVAGCGNDMLREMTMDIWQRRSGFQRVFRMDPDRPAKSQREHEGIMAALRDHDAERAAKLALLHKRSVGESVTELVDEAASCDGAVAAAEEARAWSA